MKKGSGSGGVEDIHVAQCLVDLGGVAALATGDEVVRVERQTMLGLFGEMSEVCASLACDDVDVVKGRRNGQYWECWRERDLGNQIGSRDVVKGNSCVGGNIGTIFKAEHAFERPKSES